MHTTTTKCPNDTTSDNYDIYADICHVAAQCELICITFHHVKGHQDKDPNCLLTVVEQLNVECNK